MFNGVFCEYWIHCISCPYTDLCLYYFQSFTLLLPIKSETTPGVFHEHHNRTW